MTSHRLIVALDVSDRATALQLTRELRDEVAMVKIGLEGFTAHGPELVRAVRDLGVDVFLDLKVHDIPRTAAAAAREASRLGVRLLTVHAAGGAEMIAAARDALTRPTELVAVTVLTSLDDSMLSCLGVSGSTGEIAERWGEIAIANGADGLVCSAHELERLGHLAGKRVVPGVRPSGSAGDDQRRVATPRTAVRAGATWLVVGRPIVQAPDPLAAARAINAELAALGTP